MSAYVTLATPLLDEDALVAALGDLGFPRERVEVHDVGVPLVGFEGARREQQAHIVIRRRHVGAGSNDLGFERTATGFRFHVSDHDRGRYGGEWQAKLRARYDVHHRDKVERLAAEERRREEERREEERRRLVEAQRLSIHEKARKLGYRVEESREGDRLRLVLVKRVY